MSALSLRLPAALKSEAVAYADSLGLSLNALVAVSLRDYLDARARVSTAAAVDAPSVAGAAATAASTPVKRPAPLETVAIAQKPTPSVDPFRAKALALLQLNTRAICPCGSGQRAKACHGGAA